MPSPPTQHKLFACDLHRQLSFKNIEKLARAIVKMPSFAGPR